MNMISVMDKKRINTLLLGESKSFLNQGYQFWIVQTFGWVAYTVLVFLAIIQPQFSREDFNLSGQIINLCFEASTGFVLSYLQWIFIGKIVHLSLNRTLVLSFCSASILGLIHNVIKLAGYKVIVYQQGWNEGWNMLEFGGWLLFSLTTMFVWTSIFFIMLYNTRLQKEHEKLLRAQTETKDAQLQMLRYQLNPHFMFNTINAISTLIYKNENDKANEMLDQLCEFFRYSLDTKSQNKTTLAKEIQLMESYLSIEKVRFGSRLKIKLKISNAARNAKVPSMLLQPLVENAIKYAIEPRKEPGLIKVLAEQLDGRLNISICDDGDGVNEKVSNGFGIGISNTKARLDTMFDGDYELQFIDNASKGTSVIISIPFEE